MNRTKIEWTDFTWNPVTGCWGPGGTAEKPNRCSYCYAEKVARRFNRIKRGDPFTPDYFPNGDRLEDAFTPTFHFDRFSQPSKVKKPSHIFVCSMADLFGDWVPSEWINAVLGAVGRAPQHIFQFLTKNPQRLPQWNGLWPDNAWVGTTVTNQADMDERGYWLLQVDAPVRFVSHEPILGNIDARRFLCVESNPCSGGCESGICESLQWGIIGAQTGPGAVRPEVDWVMNLAQQYRDAGVSLFLKDNLGFQNQPQEWPKP